MDPMLSDPFAELGPEEKPQCLACIEHNIHAPEVFAITKPSVALVFHSPERYPASFVQDRKGKVHRNHSAHRKHSPFQGVRQSL